MQRRALSCGGEEARAARLTEGSWPPAAACSAAACCWLGLLEASPAQLPRAACATHPRHSTAPAVACQTLREVAGVRSAIAVVFCWSWNLESFGKGQQLRGWIRRGEGDTLVTHTKGTHKGKKVTRREEMGIEGCGREVYGCVGNSKTAQCISQLQGKEGEWTRCKPRKRYRAAKRT
jgi:hypothetical protein